MQKKKLKLQGYTEMKLSASSMVTRVFVHDKNYSVSVISL